MQTLVQVLVLGVAVRTVPSLWPSAGARPVLAVHGVASSRPLPLPSGGAARRRITHERNATANEAACEWDMQTAGQRQSDNEPFLTPSQPDHDISQWSARLTALRFRFESLDSGNPIRVSELPEVLRLLSRRCERYLQLADSLMAWRDAISYQKLAPTSPVALQLLGSVYEARVLYRSSLIAYKTALRLLESSLEPADLKKDPTCKLVRERLEQLISRIKELPSTGALFSPPFVLDHHRGGGVTSTRLSVYWDCLREQPSNEDERRFQHLEVRELRRYLTASSSPALLLSSVRDQPGKLYFPRITFVKSSWTQQLPEEAAPRWERSFLEKHSYKFGLQKPSSEEMRSDVGSVVRSSPTTRYTYYQIDHLVLDVVVCDEDGLFCNSDPIVFKPGQGDGFELLRCRQTVVLAWPAAFERDGSPSPVSLLTSMSTSSGGVLQTPAGSHTIIAGRHSQRPPITLLLYSRWVNNMAFRLTAEGLVAEILRSDGNGEPCDGCVSPGDHRVFDTEIEALLVAAIGEPRQEEMRKQLLDALSSAERSELGRLGSGWLTDLVTDECRARLSADAHRFVQQELLPALCPLLDACVRQEVAVLCGVVMQIGDTRLVHFWRNSLCPSARRKYVTIVQLPSNALPPEIAATSAEKNRDGTWNWDEFPEGADDVTDPKRLFWEGKAPAVSSSSSSSLFQPYRRSTHLAQVPTSARLRWTRTLSPTRLLETCGSSLAPICGLGYGCRCGSTAENLTLYGCGSWWTRERLRRRSCL